MECILDRLYGHPKDRSLNGLYLFIDVWGDCNNGIRPLLDLILQESSAHQQISEFVSTRNLPKIIERLDIATETAPISLELNETYVSEEVNEFIDHKVHALTKVKRYKDNTRETIGWDNPYSQESGHTSQNTKLKRSTRSAARSLPQCKSTLSHYEPYRKEIPLPPDLSI